MKYLVELGASVSYKTMRSAIEVGNLEIISFLFENGGKVDNSQDDFIKIASMHGRLDLFKYFESNLHFPLKKNQTFDVCMEIAIERGHIQIIQYIVQNDLQSKRENEKEQKQKAEQQQQGIESSSFVKERHRKDRAQNWYSKMVYIASNTERFQILKYLMENVEEARLNNYVDENNRNSLFMAVRWGNLEIVDFLIENNVDVNNTNNLDQTPLYIATFDGKLEIVKSLIQKGKANLNKCDKVGHSCLWVACQKQRIEILKLLVENGMNPNITDKNGQTGLWIASFEGHLEVVRFLVEKCQVDINKSTNSDQSPLHAACYKGHLEVVRYLVDHGIQVNSQERNELESPLNFAVKEGKLEVVKFLVEECSVDLTHKTREGSTVLERATHERQFEIVQYLESKLK